MDQPIIDIQINNPNILDLNYVNWNKTCDITQSEISLESQFFFLSNGSDLCGDLNLNTRIGSESLNAQIFKYSPKDSPDDIFAMKVVPYIGKKESENIKNEINIGKELSESGQSWYPKIYASGKCDNVSLKKDSQLYKKYNKDIIKAYYIVYELLSYDLSQLIESDMDVSNKQMIKIISNIFDAIDDLNNEQKIAHNDLHCGNIMFKCDQKGLSISPILIDYGLSGEYEENSDVFVRKYSDVVALFNSLDLRRSKYNLKNKPNIVYAIQVINNMLIEADYIGMDKYIKNIQSFKRLFIQLAETGKFGEKYQKLEDKYKSL